MKKGKAARRFALTLDLMEWGFESVRLRLARENPRATAKQRDAMMQKWLDQRNDVLRPGERLRPGFRTKSGLGFALPSHN